MNLPSTPTNAQLPLVQAIEDYQVRSMHHVLAPFGSGPLLKPTLYQLWISPVILNQEDDVSNKLK